MGNEIVIKKSLLLALAAFVLVALVGGYILFANAPKPSGPENVVAQPNGNSVSNTNPQANPGSGAVDNQNPTASGVQEIYLKALDTGYYDKPQITVKKGVPVKLYFSADQGAGCGRYMAIDDFGVKLISKNGETQVAEFTPQNAGTYYYHCGMWMFKGKLVVV